MAQLKSSPTSSRVAWATCILPSHRVRLANTTSKLQWLGCYVEPVLPQTSASRSLLTSSSGHSQSAANPIFPPRNPSQPLYHPHFRGPRPNPTQARWREDTDVFPSFDFFFNSFYYYYVCPLAYCMQFTSSHLTSGKRWHSVGECCDKHIA